MIEDVIGINNLRIKTQMISHWAVEDSRLEEYKGNYRERMEGRK